MVEYFPARKTRERYYSCTFQAVIERWGWGRGERGFELTSITLPSTLGSDNS